MGIVLAVVVASCFCSLSLHLVFVALARAIRLNVIIIKLKLEAFQVVCGVVFLLFLCSLMSSSLWVKLLLLLLSVHNNDFVCIQLNAFASSFTNFAVG